ncbi:deoxynucleotide monophosphate kinase family protein [Polaromonas naphthalenivorans]|uniref:Deoxynucleotide monophosphate kinase n=1 Tax=Polaromonas naphthalenivorans (strain CJ2) TaxID=365044 RepID=A1VPK4_POLNA|nr:hypothetical protein [Polaromonas naphthalenivorans]ABM37582.1 hypothetical protein Pnap_2274 [Polaromonas naphthalenivorans CJ2]
MNRPHIIGLCGLASCGKDTVAQLLAVHLRFSQLAFADALRNEVCQAFGIDQSILTRRDTKEVPTPALALRRCSTVSGFAMAMISQGKWLEPGRSLKEEFFAPRSPRQIMQWWGTEYRRIYSGQDYWTRTLKARVYIQQESNQWRHVISDVRFDNEAEAVRAMGGVIWQIKRPGLKHDASHVSETDGSRFKPDLVINNCHDIKHLQALVTGAWVKSETGLDDAGLINMGSTFSRLSRS